MEPEIPADEPAPRDQPLGRPGRAGHSGRPGHTAAAAHEHAPAAPSSAAHEHAPALDPRRRLQLALAALWLLDAMLQFQPFMFGRGFGQMLAGSAHRNPAIAARPVTWSAAFIDHHTVVLNALLATVQLLLGLGIAGRPAVRLTLAASVAWARLSHRPQHRPLLALFALAFWPPAPQPAPSPATAAPAVAAPGSA